jgi:hypothetical protein
MYLTLLARPNRAYRHTALATPGDALVVTGVCGVRNAWCRCLRPVQRDEMELPGTLSRAGSGWPCGCKRLPTE